MLQHLVNRCNLLKMFFCLDTVASVTNLTRAEKALYCHTPKMCMYTSNTEVFSLLRRPPQGGEQDSFSLHSTAGWLRFQQKEPHISRAIRHGVNVNEKANSPAQQFTRCSDAGSHAKAIALLPQTRSTWGKIIICHFPTKGQMHFNVNANYSLPHPP